MCSVLWSLLVLLFGGLGVWGGLWLSGSGGVGDWFLGLGGW